MWPTQKLTGQTRWPSANCKINQWTKSQWNKCNQSLTHSRRPKNCARPSSSDLDRPPLPRPDVPSRTLKSARQSVHLQEAGVQARSRARPRRSIIATDSSARQIRSTLQAKHSHQMCAKNHQVLTGSSRRWHPSPGSALLPSPRHLIRREKRHLRVFLPHLSKRRPHQRAWSHSRPGQTCAA